MSVKTIRRRGRARKRVRIGAPDPSLTATSGITAIAEFVEALDVVGRLDSGIGSLKKRERGASAGELLVGLAQSQLLGADALVSLDRQRADVAAVELSAVPVLASTTAAGLARRFGPEQLAGVETGAADLADRGFGLLPADRKVALSAKVTLDLDSTDVEVYGSKKQGVAYNYAGQRAGRPHLATWAEAGLTTAADLLAGNDDVRPRAADMLRRGLAGIPEPVRDTARASDRLRARADAGYFTADLADAAVEQGCDFAIAAKRNTAMWRAYASIETDGWVDAIGMPGAQVAAVDYAPAGWPDGTYTIVRRVRVEAEAISADPRSRRRRTIDKDQLALALEGTATHAYAVSFIVTNIPANDRPGDTTGNAETILEVEAWFRRRTDIEDRIREAKLGAALRKLPSGDQAVNTVWMWAALLAGNLSTLLQALTGIDEHGRAHAARMRHELLCVPARLVRHQRRLILRLPPGDHLLPVVLTRIRELGTAA
ncbi:MAG: IS1380 family transposase [Alphaproteobacteria bacterium]|nr:IS1380 family transposase [Alphaproteobacteria bacterium]